MTGIKLRLCGDEELAETVKWHGASARGSRITEQIFEVRYSS